MVVVGSAIDGPAFVEQLHSPNGLLPFELAQDDDGRLSYSITMGGDIVVERSPLGIVVDRKNLADVSTPSRARPKAFASKSGIHGWAFMRRLLTIALPMSEIGELAAFAQRRGQTWFVAVLNGGAAKQIRINLGFLGASRYDALLARDEPDDPAAIAVEKNKVTSSDSLAIDRRSAGGFIGRFTEAGLS